MTDQKSHFTKCAENAIRAYPSLFPNRLTFIGAVFTGGIGGCEIESTTGNIIYDDPHARDQYEPSKFNDGMGHHEAELRYAHDLRIMQETFISKNAAVVASLSTYDELPYFRVIKLPYLHGVGLKRATLGDLSDDTMNALKEYLDRVIEAYTHAAYWAKQSDNHMHSDKVWPIDRKDVIEGYQSACDMFTSIYGIPHQTRDQQRNEIASKLIAEILSEEKAKDND